MLSKGAFKKKKTYVQLSCIIKLTSNIFKIKEKIDKNMWTNVWCDKMYSPTIPRIKI